MRFSDWTVIVTGGGAGIGRAIALAFGREGANVMVASRGKDKLDAVAAELRALGTKPMVATLSVTDEGAVSDAVRSAFERTGRLDVLVNNSGITGPAALARDISAQDFRDNLEVNLTGAFLFAKHASRVMIERRRGSIVNIASIAGRIGYALRTPYAASKWGMIGLSHSLAAELGPHGVRSNAVLPGPVRGERFDRVVAERAAAEGKSIEETERWYLKEMPLGRVVTPEEVATAVTFLASDDAASITGQALNVDGGFRMQ
jgi:NAD(P)-dependent dehydrogenase (short-subunit alcohol dehydrogenase family)